MTNLRNWVCKGGEPFAAVQGAQRWILLFIFVVVSQSAYSENECCIPYMLLSGDDFIEDSRIIYENGRSGVEEVQGRTVHKICPELLEAYERTISEDDILHVTVYHPIRKEWMDSMNGFNFQRGGIPVNNGMLRLPGMEPIKVEGLNLRQAKESLKKYLQEEIRDADIFISFREKKENSVILCGIVAASHVPIDGKTKLYEIISKARIPSEANLFASYVMRDGCTLPVDMYRLMKFGDLSQDIVMKAGDKIFIAAPHDKFAVVMGDATVQRTVPLPAGYLSLREVIAQAHGMPYTADKRNIQVIRGGISSPKIYVLSLDCIINQPNRNLLLIPGDIVYISLKPISNWNQFVVQLSGTLSVVPFALFLNSITR